MQFTVAIIALAGVVAATPNGWENWNTWTATTSTIVPSMPAYTPTTTSYYTWTTPVEHKPSSSIVSHPSASPTYTTTTPVPMPSFTGAANKGSMVGGAAVGIAAIALML